MIDGRIRTQGLKYDVCHDVLLTLIVVLIMIMMKFTYADWTSKDATVEGDKTRSFKDVESGRGCAYVLLPDARHNGQYDSMY
jgi:hypothetical protein